MNGANTLGSETKELRHVSLDRSIERLKQIREKAIDLLNRIQDGPVSPDCQKDEPRNTPSLQEIIIGGADRIDQTRDEISDILNQIENALF